MSASIWSPGGSLQVPALPAVAPVSFVKGTVGNPGINFVGDTDTGIWSESDGYLNFVVNGVTQLRIDPTGNITGNKFASGVELDITSAAVTDIGALASNSAHVLGSSAISSFGTTYRGPMFVRFASALTLTHNATTLICPGGASLSVNAGDSIVVTPKATGGTADGWVVVSYTSGSPNLNAVTSINNGQLAGLRNRIINGGMTVAQRSPGATANGAYCIDRWITSITGNAPTWTQSLGLVNGFAYSANSLLISGIVGNTAFGLSQRIEAANCRDMAGSTVTISYWVYQSTGTTVNVTTGFSYATGVDNGTYTNFIGNTSAIPVPSATWTKVTGSIAIPTAAVTGLSVALWAQGTPIGAGQILVVAGAQLEIGAVATPFEQRPNSLERGLCRNYYRVYTTVQNVNDLGYDMRIVPTQAGAGPYTYNSEL